MSALDDDPAVTAAGRNCEVVLPEADELFLDIDTPAQRAQLDAMLPVLSRNGVAISSFDEVTSLNGRTHVIVRLDRDVTPTERVAYQACLGSDPVRELLSLLRIVLNTSRPPTVFFKPRACTPRALRVRDETSGAV